MTEEVDVEGGARARADFADLIAQDRGRQQRARDRSEPAGLSNRDAKLDALRPRHRRLNDRQAGGKPIEWHEALRGCGFS
jgi:hypothetical protein